MTPIDLGSYKSIYLQTAKEYVGKMSVSLDQLSNDNSNKEALNNLYISSHSLKSQSQVMGFINMANLCVIIEKISSGALKAGRQINNDLVNILKESVEKLNLFLSQIEKGDAA